MGTPTVNIYQQLREKICELEIPDLVSNYDNAVKSHYGGTPSFTNMSEGEQMYEMNKFWLKLIIANCKPSLMVTDLRSHLFVEDSITLYIDLFMKHILHELIKLEVFNNVK